MLLKTIEIYSTDKLIRKIEFKTGVNIITDETSELKTSTGNSLGKTTVLRLVDFCLGSDGEDLFKDKEFKTLNEDLFDRLHNLGYYVNLNFLIGKIVYKVSRSLTNKKEIFLQDNKLTITELRENLEKLIFGITTSKPSIRQLMPKFIRKDISNMSNTLNFLHSTTKREDYEMVFLFLFGFNDLESLFSRYQSIFSIKKLNTRLKAIKGLKSITSLRQTEKILEKDIKEAELRIKDFKINEAYAKEFEALKEIRKKISILSLEKSTEELKLSLSKDTLKEIQNSLSTVDPIAVKAVYNQAKKFNPEIQKKFEDVLLFHNEMVKNKESFVSNSIVILTNKINELDLQLSAEIATEEKIIKLFSDTGSLADLQILQKEINSLYEKKGHVTNSITIINGLEIEISTQQEKVEIINSKIADYFQDYDNKITDFNIYFSQFSKELYKEEFIFVYDVSGKNNNKDLTFKIDNITSNEGGGKKKAQVAAFDLAYIPFSIDRGIKGPKFVMHDSIEDVHVNQIETLFNIANKFNKGQYIISVLKDKISPLGEVWIKENVILKLSQNDKLFKLQ